MCVTISKLIKLKLYRLKRFKKKYVSKNANKQIVHTYQLYTSTHLQYNIYLMVSTTYNSKQLIMLIFKHLTQILQIVFRSSFSLP